MPKSPSEPGSPNFGRSDIVLSYSILSDYVFLVIVRKLGNEFLERIKKTDCWFGADGWDYRSGDAVYYQEIW